MLYEKEFSYGDLFSIEMNDYAKNNMLNGFLIAGFLNDLKAKTVFSEKKIEAILFAGKIRDNSDRWYVFAIYAKDCSKMIARYVRKKIIEKSKEGYHIVTEGDGQGLEKFHNFIFREKL